VRLRLCMIALALGAMPAAAADISPERKAELDAEIAGMTAEKIEALFADLFAANGCQLSMVEEQSTDRKIMSHFSAALHLTPEEADAVHDPLQDRIQIVSRDMVVDGLIAADTREGVVRMQNCTPDLASAGQTYVVPGVGIVGQDRFVELVKGHFTVAGCVVDFSENAAAQSAVLETVFAALSLDGAAAAAAKPSVDTAMRDVFEKLVSAGEITVNETDMSAALVDCNG